MFASKANMLYRRANSFRWKFNTKNFATAADNNPAIIRESANEALSKSHILSRLPLIAPEIRNGPDYMQVFPDVVRELTDYSRFTLLPNDFKVFDDHFTKMLDHVNSNGHRDMVKILTNMYQDLMVNKEITAENIKLAQLLGWCIEIHLCAFIVEDDIIDDCEVRRSKPCWHKVEGMERFAVNDMLMLENGCHTIINRYFGHLPCYSGMVQTVMETFMVSLLGTMLEFHYRKMGPDTFTLERFNYTQILKGCFYRFYMSAALAMMLAGYDLNTHQKSFEAVKLISHEIGPYYQAQNDYYDCFANQCLNKPGLDIQIGQITWLATMAMELANENQKDIMRQNYGKEDADCVAKVKKLYEDLRIPELYHDYKERNQKKVMSLIDEFLQSDETLRNACINYFSQGYEAPSKNVE